MQYNALGQAAQAAPARLPVGLPPGVESWAVSTSSGVTVPAQIVPLSARDVALRALYGGDNLTQIAWLCFETDLPAAGYTTFFLSPVTNGADAPGTSHSYSRKLSPRVDAQISNGRITLTVSAQTGFLSQYEDNATGLSLPLAQVCEHRLHLI